jgi:predicted ATPase
VQIVAGPGLGKTRLVAEFRRTVGDDVGWLQGGCSPWSRGVAYTPIAELLRGLFCVSEDRRTGAGRQMIEARLAPRGGDLAPALCHVLRLGPPDPAFEALDGRERRLAVLDAMAGVLEQEAARNPVVVVVEDVHWVDEASEAVIARFGELTRSLPILLIVTARPGYVPRRRATSSSSSNPWASRSAPASAPRSSTWPS